MRKRTYAECLPHYLAGTARLCGPELPNTSNYIGIGRQGLPSVNLMAHDTGGTLLTPYAPQATWISPRSERSERFRLQRTMGTPDNLLLAVKFTDVQLAAAAVSSSKLRLAGEVRAF